MNVISIALQLIIMFKKSEELILLSKPLNSSIAVGESLSFECSFDKENQVVAWLTGSNILYVGNTQFNAPNSYLSESFSDKHLNISGSNLTILNVTREDDRSYTCSVKGSNISATASLNVLTPPGPPFIGFDELKVRYEGDVITLNCSSDGGNPAPRLLWKRNGSFVFSARFIPHQNKFSITSSLLSWKLSAEDHLINFTCVIPDVGSYASIIFQVNYAPIIYVGIHNPLVVVEGSNLTINCAVSSYPSSQIYWKRNNKTEFGSSFFIANISPSDEGSYVCHAKNFIEKQKILKLVVLQVPFVQMTLRHFDEIQGINEIQLEKEINDEETVQIKELQSIQAVCKCEDANGEEDSWWNKDGEYHGSTMFLRQVKRHQSGIYSCSVSRNLQPSLQPPSLVTSSKLFNLSVLYKPGRSFITLPKSIIVGQISVLKCHATDEGYPKAEFVWFRDGYEIFRGEQLQLQTQLSDSGIYTCNAFNVIGRGESNSKEIVVNEPPKPLAIDQQKFVTVKAGDCDDIKLKCSVRGRPSPTIKWFKDGQAVEGLDSIKTTSTLMNDSSFNVTSVFFLRGSEAPMVPFSIMDAGDYMCLAKNIVSKDTIVMSITVDVKFAPTIFSKSQQFVKTFENGLITFDVRSNPAPTIEWINVTETMKVNSSRFSIKRLSSTNNTYRALLELNPVLGDDLQNYTIIASNECGNDTSVIQVKAAECPEAPNNLTISSASWESVELTWVEGYNGGFPQNFVVQMTSTGKNFNHFTYFSHSTKINISGLIPRSSYAIKVFGENKIGKSKMSNEVILQELRLNSPVKAEYLFKEQIILLSLPKHMYANRVETKVEIWQDTCVRIDIFNGLSWFTEIPCSKKLKIFLGTSKMKAVEIKVFLCLERIPDICSEGIFAEVDAPGKIVSHLVTILIGSLCGTLILIFSVMVIVLCIRKMKSFDRQALKNKDRNSEMLGSNESTISHIRAVSPHQSSATAVNESSNHEHWLITSCAENFPFLHIPAYCLQAGDCTHTPSTVHSLHPLTASPGFINDLAQPKTRRVVYEVIV